MTSSPSCPTLITGSAPPDWIPVTKVTALDYCVLSAPTNQTMAFMAACCAPYVVQTAGRCYNWCEIPQHYFAKGETSAEINEVFLSCLVGVANGTLENVGMQCKTPSASGARPRPSFNAATWAVTVFVLLHSSRAVSSNIDLSDHGHEIRNISSKSTMSSCDVGT